MEPIDMTYDICRCYVKDQADVVDPVLVKRVDGFRRARNLAGLATCSLHFDWAYHTVDDFRFLRQVEAFFKKNSLFSHGETCRDAALSTFLKSEEQCAQTNLRLEYFYAKRDQLDPDLDFQLSRMERYIRNVLGDFRSFLDDLPHLVKVTPGATARSARRYSLPQLKMRMKLYASRGAEGYLRALYRYFGFNAPRILVCESNRVELVPKNWKTDRTIACEPEGCIPLQLAFDTYAKRRLRRYGIDLSDQSANREAARKGSIDGSIATVDFSAASDTVSFNAVAWLFPYDWFEFLCQVRSPYYRGVFGEGQYQKFSSMGNGTTFTIETLLFAAACFAVGSRGFLVYGDDVIIEPEFFEAYKRLTRFLGFSINEEKTFSTGPFRESCGLDSFGGVEVTPKYIRNIDSRKANLCHLVNTLAEICVPDGHLARYLVDIMSTYKLPRVPYTESTISGVWTYPEIARGLGNLKTKSYVDRARVYVPKTRERVFVDIRGYYLWFLNKNSQVLFGGPWHLARNCSFNETSSVPIFEHKYVRKWVAWTFPRNGMPDHLYWWSEWIEVALK